MKKLRNIDWLKWILAKTTGLYLIFGIVSAVKNL